MPLSVSRVTPMFGVEKQSRASIVPVLAVEYIVDMKPHVGRQIVAGSP